MWECVGGSVLKGEDSRAGAVREVQEEVGIDLPPEQGKLLFSVTRRVVNGVPINDILDVWLWDYNGPVTLAKATTDEVAQAAWMAPERIRKMFDAGKMVDTLNYFFTEVSNDSFRNL